MVMPVYFQYVILKECYTNYSRTWWLNIRKDRHNLLEILVARAI